MLHQKARLVAWPASQRSAGAGSSGNGSERDGPGCGVWSERWFWWVTP